MWVILCQIYVQKHKPGYPFPSMSKVPDIDWPNIKRAGWMRFPDNFYKKKLKSIMYDVFFMYNVSNNYIKT